MTGRIVVDGQPIEFRPGDSVAVAVLRTGEVPGRGGTLCLAGDCPNCLATVDGIAYVRTCQVTCRPGLEVVRHPAIGMPPLPEVRASNVAVSPPAREIHVERREVERGGHRGRQERPGGGRGGESRRRAGSPRPRLGRRRRRHGHLPRPDDRGANADRDAARRPARDRRRHGCGRDPAGRSRGTTSPACSRSGPRNGFGLPASSCPSRSSRWDGSSSDSRAMATAGCERW